MMRHRIAALTAATVLLAGGALATATSASAAVDPPGGSWDHTWTTVDSAHGGTVYVEEHGDVVSVCDSAADGMAPRVQVWTQSSSGQYNSRYIIEATGGLGSCKTVSASDGGIYDLPENVSIAVSIWLGPSVGHLGSEHTFLNDH
ncbi:hypothetical protein [Kitasatospora sp. NPDC085879]|uniref:hypothetical protein n=1 Tax=Kitasatospora sp. NPDC085879 TaxID=3154769 RepID=UPI003434EAE4